MKKEDLVKGKWYMWTNSGGKTQHFLKFDGINGSSAVCNEYIHYGVYKTNRNEWIYEHLIECLPEDYIKYLPANTIKQNSSTDFIFEPGGIYEGIWENKEYPVIFKTKTGSLNEECWLITNNWAEYFHQQGCCNSSGIKFKKATEDNAKWLNACIAADKFISKEYALQLKSMEQKSLIGRYIKALIDHPQSGLVMCGEYGKIITSYSVDFPSQKNYNFTIDYQKDGKPVYELMPEGWTPERAATGWIPQVGEYAVMEKAGGWGYDPQNNGCIAVIKEVKPRKGNGHNIPEDTYNISGIVINPKRQTYIEFKEVPIKTDVGYICRKAHSNEIPTTKLDPQNWCVKLTPENKKDIVQYFNTKHNRKAIIGSGGYYGYGESTIVVCRTKAWGRLLTNDEFYELILQGPRVLSNSESYIAAVDPYDNEELIKPRKEDTPSYININSDVTNLKISTSEPVLLKNTEKEVKILVKQSQTIKIN